MEDLGGVWRTIGGRRAFIKDGQSLGDAMKKSRKFKEKKYSEMTDKEISEKIDNLNKQLNEGFSDEQWDKMDDAWDSYKNEHNE